MTMDTRTSAGRYAGGSGSAISIGGHAIHPMLVPLPIAALLAYLSTTDTFWARASFTLLAVALITGALAGVVGALEAVSLQRARSSGRVWTHAAINVLVLAMAVASFKICWESDGLWAPSMVYLSAVIAALLLVSGWLGGSIVYKHGIGVSEGVGPGIPDGNPDLTAGGRLDIARER